MMKQFTNNRSIKKALCTTLVLFGAVLHNAGSYGEFTSDDITIPLKEKGTDVYYLEATLGETRTDLLLDTGSGYLALNEKLIKSLEADGLASYRRSVRARLASGKIQEVPIYQVSDISLGTGCTLHNVEAAMLEGSTRNILGMNILKNVKRFYVSFGEETLTLQGCNEPQSHTASL